MQIFFKENLGGLTINTTIQIPLNRGSVSPSQNCTTILAMLGHAYTLAGKKNEAMEILQELQERAHDTFVSSFDMALTYIGLGRKGDALDWLQKVYEERLSSKLTRSLTVFDPNPVLFRC